MEEKPLQIPYNMQDKIIRILSTRPLSEALIAKAAKQNVVLETETFISVQKKISSETTDNIKVLALSKATIVFTSMNAVEIVSEILSSMNVIPEWEIYCMGGTTLSLVKNIWSERNIKGTAKNATELAERIIADKVKDIQFFCGNIRREELPALLKNENIEVNEWMVYETIFTPLVIEKAYDGILFFSPSAVECFFSANKTIEKTVLFAIGNTTEASLKQFCNNTIVTSEFPDKEQLVNKAIHYLQTNQ